MDIHGKKKKFKFSTFDPLTSFELNGLLENDGLKTCHLIFVAIGGKVE